MRILCGSFFHRYLPQFFPPRLFLPLPPTLFPHRYLLSPHRVSAIQGRSRAEVGRRRRLSLLLTEEVSVGKESSIFLEKKVSFCSCFLFLFPRLLRLSDHLRRRIWPSFSSAPRLRCGPWPRETLLPTASNWCTAPGTVSDPIRQIRTARKGAWLHRPTMHQSTWYSAPDPTPRAIVTSIRPRWPNVVRPPNGPA